VNPATARANRDIGIALSSLASGEEWKEDAIDFVRRYLETHERLHVDWLWSAGLAVPKSSRALGAVIQHAAREKWMEQIVLSDGMIAALPSMNSRQQLKPVWRSLIYRNIDRQVELVF